MKAFSTRTLFFHRNQWKLCGIACRQVVDHSESNSYSNWFQREVTNTGENITFTAMSTALSFYVYPIKPLRYKTIDLLY